MTKTGRGHVLQDANWNTTALVTTAGAVVERYMYSPYGVVNIRNWNWSLNSNPGGSYQWVYLHQGGRLNADAGLYHFRHRDYSPTLGRWMNQDPLGYVDGGNLYEYVRSGPTGAVDPMGLTSWQDFADSLGIASRLSPEAFPNPPQIVVPPPSTSGESERPEARLGINEDGTKYIIPDYFELGPDKCGDCESRLPVYMREVRLKRYVGDEFSHSGDTLLDVLDKPDGIANPAPGASFTAKPVFGDPYVRQVIVRYACIRQPHRDSPRVSSSEIEMKGFPLRADVEYRYDWSTE